MIDFVAVKTTILSIFRQNAIESERRGLCTTYLYADTDTYEISGYFSLTHKALSISSFSKERRKDIAGSKTAEVASFILLGQLGKRMEQMTDGSINASGLSGDKMLEDVFLSLHLQTNISSIAEYLLNAMRKSGCWNSIRDMVFDFLNAMRENVLFISS